MGGSHNFHRTEVVTDKVRTDLLYSNIEKLPVGMKFWKSCFYDYNGQPIWPLSPTISVLTYSNASGYGWGGYSVNLNGYVAKGNFSPHKYSNSPTWQELKQGGHIFEKQNSLSFP